MTAAADQPFITVARVIKPQGRHGEVAVDLLTDFPERFTERRKLRAVLPDGKRRELDLSDFWQHKGRLVMKFAGVDSISEAETLVGCELQIAPEERAELEAGDVYVSDLVGCRVFASEPERPAAEVGRIGDVIFGAGSAPLLLIHQEGDGKPRELMIPFAQEYIGKLDIANKRLDMILPDGMLELDAPLSAEEKRDQQRGG